ncbi:dihydrolipoyllysine-residue acetyltransferase [Shewanella marina]|uniref:dihydrolipoyllysine-residue acetyltransferase n=1 Tax=Shewanella marina TaxID=487319 RepID=UPI0004706EAC|nr:dihydrolipoyllysine-residue acetyltransferase [Shewanella marina]
MIKEFILPDIGEGVIECELVEWLVEEGQQVAEDQPIADVMTDKALVQIPTPFAGVIQKLYYQKGEIAKVHQPLFAVEALEIDTAVSSNDDSAAEVLTTRNEQQAYGTEDFMLPDIGEGIVECELVEWLVSEGQFVNEDDPIADVMTDKALVQIPALKTGKIKQLYYRQGQLAQVHQPLYSIEVPIEGQPLPADALMHQVNNEVDNAKATLTRQGKAVASPAVRRLARSHDIDISLVNGTGKNGRVYKEDVQLYIDNGNKQVVANVIDTIPAEFENTVVVPCQSQTRVEPIKGIQAAMAKMMTTSVSTIPHFTYSEEIDITKLCQLRQSLKQKYSTESCKLTLMPFFIKALSLAINQFPILNSQVNQDCTEITYLNDHNIGVAVDSKMGLIVPNIKHVNQKSLLEVATDLTSIIDSARTGRVAPELLKQGTITISNIGAIGGTVATPIINKPEVAIVALGRIQKLPRFNHNGDVEARQILQVSWSGDHRIIDGATMAKFCNVWKQYLETPAEMLLNLR